MSADVYDLFGGEMRHTFSGQHRRAETTTSQSLVAVFKEQVALAEAAEVRFRAEWDKATGHDRVANVAWVEWWRLNSPVQPGDVVTINGEPMLVCYIGRCRGWDSCECHGAALNCVTVEMRGKTKRGGWRKDDVTSRDRMKLADLAALKVKP